MLPSGERGLDGHCWLYAVVKFQPVPGGQPLLSDYPCKEGVCAPPSAAQRPSISGPSPFAAWPWNQSPEFQTQKSGHSVKPQCF